MEKMENTLDSGRDVNVEDGSVVSSTTPADDSTPLGSASASTKPKMSNIWNLPINLKKGSQNDINIERGAIASEITADNDFNAPLHSSLEHSESTNRSKTVLDKLIDMEMDIATGTAIGKISTDNYMLKKVCQNMNYNILSTNVLQRGTEAESNKDNMLSTGTYAAARKLLSDNYGLSTEVSHNMNDKRSMNVAKNVTEGNKDYMLLPGSSQQNDVSNCTKNISLTQMVPSEDPTRSDGKEGNQVAFDILNDLKDFVPYKILDVTSLGYCTYCFTAHEDIHEDGGCSLTACPPSYWPSSWYTIKVLSYKHTVCIFNSCNFCPEHASDLLEHIANEHVTTDLYALSSEEISPEDGILSNDGMETNEATQLLSNVESEIETGVTQATMPNTAKDEMLEATPSTSKFPGPKKGDHYRCGLCYVITPELNVITQHYIHVHNINRLLICEPCFFISHYKHSLDVHWARFHHRKDKMPEYLFFTKEDNIDLTSLKQASTQSSSDTTALPDHTEENYNMYMIKKVTKYSIKCTFCDYYTKQIGNIKHHYQTKHWTAVSETLIDLSANTTTYRCITCSAVESSSKQIALHYVKQHMRLPATQCELCEIKLADLTKLKTHTTSEKHKEFYRRSLRCTKCLFATMSKKNLMKHAIEHAPNFKCGECDFVTRVKSVLKKHVGTMHTRKKHADGFYHCNECAFLSKKTNDMQHHHRINHGVNSGNNVTCELCDFVAANQLGYTKHLKSHRAAASGVAAKDLWKCQ